MPWTLPTVPLTSVPLTRTDDVAATPAVPVADEEVLRSGWLETLERVQKQWWGNAKNPWAIYKWYILPIGGVYATYYLLLKSFFASQAAEPHEI